MVRSATISPKNPSHFSAKWKEL